MKSFVNFKLLFPVFITLLSFSLVSAQQDPECGTIVTPENEAYIKKLMPKIKKYEREYFQKMQQRASTPLSSVPIKAHIIRTDSGGGGLSVAQLNNAIATMNSYYANAFLEFFLCEDINYINDSEYYNFTTDQEDVLTDANNVDNVINIYFTNSVTTTNGGGLCGYAYFPGGPETILMANQCTTNGSTLSHEMGHFFALSHTHGNTNGQLTDELVDGSNCETEGDFLCDTPADPQLSNSKVNSSCIYTANEFDANGQIFTPNTRNIMSYSRTSCRNEISPQQYARIYGTYQASRSVMACPSFNIDLAAEYTRDCSNTLDVNFTDNSVGATSWAWDINGDNVVDYTTQNPSHTYTAEGNYDVVLSISDGTTTISKVYLSYIDVGFEDINTTELELTLTTDDWPNETSWEFKDSGGTVLYSSPEYIDDVDDFQVFTYSFTVDLNECYNFQIFDSFGDGMCCFSGDGSYSLATFEGDIVASGGEIGFGETTYINNNDPLSIDEYFVNNKMSIYPNPTSNVLNIQLSNTNNLPDSYRIYTILGQEITHKTILGLEDLSFKTDHLSEGVYYLKVSKGNQSTTLSFIKN